MQTRTTHRTISTAKRRVIPKAVGKDLENFGLPKGASQEEQQVFMHHFVVLALDKLARHYQKSITKAKADKLQCAKTDLGFDLKSMITIWTLGAKFAKETLFPPCVH